MEEIDIFRYFPRNICYELRKKINLDNYYTLEEIRIRINKPIILKFNNSDIILDYLVSQEDILEILQYICDNSIYSYQNQICNGFITLKNGHRVGISGNIVIEDEKVKNINYIYSLNFRIAKQIIGAANGIVKYVINNKNDDIYNTLIISPPGCGKTTMLRDLIRQLSNGIKEISFKGRTIGLVDERGEIAAMYKGIVQNELGIRTDVLSNIPKSLGMKMLIRSMAPNIICADEIGSIEDVEAIEYAVCCGVKGIFTAHGNEIEDLNLNTSLNSLLERNIIDKLIFLDRVNKGKIKYIYSLEKGEYCKIVF